MKTNAQQGPKQTAGQQGRSSQNCGKLVICPTPLGNLGDMSPRALEALREADVVCCEDTRVTGKLLAALGVEGVRLERMDEATIRMPINRASITDGPLSTDFLTYGDVLIGRVLEGETIVYCSDAGMPGVSDPGQLLVALAREMGAPVEVLPGPTAATTAYVASGFTCPRFYFGGFFPRKAGERTKVLESLRVLDAVAIFYESPKRLVACLEAIADVLPLRTVAVCRELSKLHEEVVIDFAPALADHFAAREANEGIKGEIVVVVDVASEDEFSEAKENAFDRAAQAAQSMLSSGELTKKEILKKLQNEYGISRNAAYQLVHMHK